ncbi:hypothetical protein FS749_007691 [Ceratobasidium sp. UAMH 11750]|nr:hypothetical protein FS749_007691 [Ceratobasidium sp. UAMH 11750]
MTSAFSSGLFLGSGEIRLTSPTQHRGPWNVQLLALAPPDVDQSPPSSSPPDLPRDGRTRQRETSRSCLFSSSPF